MPKIPVYQRERTIPGVGPGVSGDIRTLSLVPEAAAGLGRAVSDVSESFLEAQRVTDLSNLTIDATRQLSALEMQYENSHEVDPEKFLKDSQQIYTSFESQIKDKAVGRLFQSNFNKK